MTWITRFTIALAAVSTLALVAVLVLYFQHIAVPPLVMGVGLYGLPVAFILGAVVIAYSIRQRRRVNRRSTLALPELVQLTPRN